MYFVIIAIFVTLNTNCYLSICVFKGIHASCEKISKSGMKKIKELEKYKCSFCKLKEEKEFQDFLEDDQ